MITQTASVGGAWRRAVDLKADYLVSRANDSLDLMKWEQEEGRAFQWRVRFPMTLVEHDAAGLTFQSIVYFAKYPNLPRNILGR